MALDKNIENLLIFDKLSELGSVEKTALYFDLSRVTVYRKIKELESYLGHQGLLQNNRKNGVVLSPFGEQVHKEASALRNNIEDIKGRLTAFNQNTIVKKNITILTTTGFLSLLVMRAIDAYLEIDSSVSFTVNTINEEFDPRKFTYDIGFFPQADLDVKKYLIKETGEIESVYFASKKYIQKYGKPKSLEDLKSHRLIHFHLSEKFYRGPADWVLKEEIFDGVPCIKINSLFARICAVSLGTGIANMPRAVNKMLGLGLVELDDVSKSSANTIGFVLKTKHNQKHIKEFFDFSIQTIVRTSK